MNKYWDGTVIFIMSPGWKLLVGDKFNVNLWFWLKYETPGIVIFIYLIEFDWVLIGGLNVNDIIRYSEPLFY